MFDLNEDWRHLASFDRNCFDLPVLAQEFDAALAALLPLGGE